MLPLSVVSPRFHLSYLARCQRQRVRQSCCRRGEPRPLLLPRCRRRNAVAGITFVAAGDASRCRSASCYCAYSCPCCRRANCRFEEERRRHRRGRGLGHPARVRAEGRRHGESRAKIKRKIKKNENKKNTFQKLRPIFPWPFSIPHVSPNSDLAMLSLITRASARRSQRGIRALEALASPGGGEGTSAIIIAQPLTSTSSSSSFFAFSSVALSPYSPYRLLASRGFAVKHHSEFVAGKEEIKESKAFFLLLSPLFAHRKQNKNGRKKRREQQEKGRRRSQKGRFRQRRRKVRCSCFLFNEQQRQ